MEFEQLVKRLEWLDEEHRKTRTSIIALEERMAALGVPKAGVVLAAGFVLNFIGAFSLAVDFHRAWGAASLILFTLLASLIFHRWWLVQDPLLRHLHIGNLLVNAGVAGGLLLVAAI